MNVPDNELIRCANTEAIFALYMYIAHKANPHQKQTLASITTELNLSLHKKPWKGRDKKRLQILTNAVTADPVLAESRIVEFTRSRNGMTACAFTKPNGEFSVSFRGTGKGEWIDNGEGLSGIPEENIYLFYGENGKPIHKTVTQDYATDQQVQALNWFRYILAKNQWNTPASIVLSGHSKGGNKAQFVTAHSDLVRVCYSFDGQGFSPEALTMLQERHSNAYDTRRQRMIGISADNDYVNVLGKHLIPEQNLFFLESDTGLHYLEAMMDDSGSFHAPCEQGNLSRYIQTVSDEIMEMPPAIRQYATLGVMNLLQTFLGRGTPVNNDAVSLEQTVAGLGIALGPLLRNISKTKNAP